MSEKLLTAELPAKPSIEILKALGSLVRSATLTSEELDAHIKFMKNPNTFGRFAVPFQSGDIETEEGLLYRQVGLEAVQDLARAGIVRNGATAEGVQHPRWGHRVFWSQGESGVYMPTGGRAVVVAPEEVAAEGWVPASAVSSVFTNGPDGEVIDILKS